MKTTVAKDVAYFTIANERDPATLRVMFLHCALQQRRAQDDGWEVYAGSQLGICSDRGARMIIEECNQDDGWEVCAGSQLGICSDRGARMIIEECNQDDGLGSVRRITTGDLL